MKKLAIYFCIALLTFACTTSVSAMSFTLQNVIIIDYNEPSGGGGLDIFTDASSYVPYTTPNLALGGSDTFLLFDIWTDEVDVSFFEDTRWKEISVAFLFTAPPASGNDIYGQTRGRFFPQDGIVRWDQGETYTFEDTGSFIVELADTSFGLGGVENAGTVKATITYDSAGSVSVPEPETMLMLGFSLLGLVVVSRKRFNNTKANS